MATPSAQLDELLNGWQQKLSSVSQNLYDLDNLPTYQRLTGTSGMPQAQLTGQTQQVVQAALSDLNRLFQSFDLLRQTIDRACALRNQLPRFGKTDDKIADIVAFLSSESIELPVDASPLPSRDLSMSVLPFQTVTPISLLMTMSQLFQSAAAVIFRVDAAWNQLDAQLIALYNQIHPIEAQIQQLSQTYPGALPEDLRHQLDTVRSQIKSAQLEIDRDPLTAQQSVLVDIEAPLHNITQQIADLTQARDQVAQHLQRAHADFQTLHTLNAESSAKFTELREKVLNLPLLKAPLEHDQITGLQQWLDRLQTTFNLGNVLPVKVGLSKWQSQLDSAIAHENLALTSYHGPLQLRSELRGRLTVLKAKATALGVAENSPLAELEQQAQQILYTRPSDLDRASEVLKTYDQSLNARI